MLIRSVPPPATGQRLGIGQRLRFATCEEVDCDLLLNGRTFIHVDRSGRSQVIIHKAGDPCGPKCTNDVCPCVNNGLVPGANGYPHHVPDERYGPHFTADGRLVGMSEYLDRMGDGVAAMQLVHERGI